MNRLSLCWISLGMFICMDGHAQDNPFLNDFNSFRQETKANYDNFRDEANKQYADFLRKAWEDYKRVSPVPKPKDEDKPPVVLADKDKGKEQKSNPLPIKETVKPPVVEPQPEPVAPIQETPTVKDRWLSFVLYGTSMKARVPENKTFHLSGCSEESVADGWKQLSSNEYNNTIHDCLELRTTRHLSDWAYLNLLAKLAETSLGRGNEATLLTAYLYCQSGYKMRLATASGSLYMLYASQHTVLGVGYYTLGGVKYYPFNCDEEQMHICDVAFPKEKAMSLLLPTQQELDVDKSEPRTLVSEAFGNMKATVCVNKNLISFYNNYPTSRLGKDIMTRWAMYANTPMDETVKESLYPALRANIAGLSEKDAMERLLNWVQTGFVYEYDDKVWGHDRAFFAEETLFYPYCDCEDRSIMLSRLVRDLLGLKCILIYYPGHLAMAVNFHENVRGDYIQLKDQKYVVCDPTYINASVGMTMPNMDNSSATVILLE